MVKFDKASHSYKNIHTNQDYISATSLINKFKKKFDTDFHAKRVADKEGVSPDVIKERWKTMNTESKIKGSNTHEAIDAFNKTGIIDKKYEALLLTLQALKLYDRENSKCEELVFNHNYKIAGTADCIEDCGQTFNVYDFKTNKKFNLFSPYNSLMLDPISHLSECEYNIYSLQLSLYAFMYSNMTGKGVGKLAAIHIDSENKLNIFYTPYLYSDILKMLNYGKN